MNVTCLTQGAGEEGIQKLGLRGCQAAACARASAMAWMSCGWMVGGAATMPPSMSSHRPAEKSKGFPVASLTHPPASVMMTAPAAWSQIFSR
mmetsp:Transcript_8432/g.23785  ORF Transcript_8432/g.23785 Transcript_8432/m.23785 type:complete len:92 (+) Transcript_8432:13-288(+)